MRRLITATILLGIFIFISELQLWSIRANEYFGDGKMLIHGEENMTGLIFAWGIYAIYGTKEDCRIAPIWSPVEDAEKVECRIRLNDKEKKFRGWINFRGHERPFCGMMAGDLPDKCFGE